MMNKRGFASDNNAGVHPDILKAVSEANNGHAVGYGDDDITRQAQQLFKDVFGAQAQVFFVFNGTGANVVALQAICRPFEAVIATSVAHINVDECGSPEKMTGSKILSVDTPNGKLTVADIEKFMHAIGVEHHAQPKVVSITQSTELGTVYSLSEIKAICDYAHTHNLIVHLDGARISNAAASLGCTFKEMTTDLGVDVVSFGGTKNGMMMGEAVVFLNADLAKNTKYIRKQSAQLMSKMRFVSAQFIAFLNNNLWFENANHANKMAKLLAEKVRDIPNVEITQPVESNGVFARIPKETIERLQSQFFFYVWDHHQSEVRWMTSFDTTVDDIEQFAQLLAETVS